MRKKKNVVGVLMALGSLLTTIANAQMSSVNVTTQHNDISRTGAALSETILTPANVSAGQFGKIWSQAFVGQVFAQPLYISNLTIAGGTHNVVYVATRSDLVYAFDADSNVGSNSAPLWQVSLLDAAHGAANGAQNYEGAGVNSTPVIDPLSHTMYVVAESFEGGQPVFKLHALDLTSGAEKFNGPTMIQGSVPGTALDGTGGVLKFIAANQKQTVSLLLLNGVVYVAFGSSNEGQETLWHGWIFAYSDNSLNQTGIACTTPNGDGGGIWMSGAGLAADQLDPVGAPFGRMFVASGNGDFTGTFPYSANMDLGDSIFSFDLSQGALRVIDDFTPSVQALLKSKDGDQGAGGVLVLPPQTNGNYPNLLVQAGKSGTLYLLDRDNLGGYNTLADEVVQSLPLALGASNLLGVGSSGSVGSPAYWNGNVYFWQSNDYLKSFTLTNGLFSATPSFSSEQTATAGTSPSISANGTTQGIVWAVYAVGTTSILIAHDASNVATTLYSSATNAARDGLGAASHHAFPTIANGNVYVAAANQLSVYGLVNSAQTSPPTLSPASSTGFVGSVSIALADATPNAAIYYTTDGSPATTASTLYTGPISVASSQTINAVASAAGSAMSYQSSGIYVQSVTATPTFSPPAVAYPTPQLVMINEATNGATIYYTTDGTAPSTGSSVFSAPISVSKAETLNAFAVAPGRIASNVASTSYTINSASTLQINEGAGFASSSGMRLVGAATIANNALQLTSATGGAHVASSWYGTPVNVQAFVTDFYFQETTAAGNGFTFTLQNAPAGVRAIGGVANGGLGYQGISSSVAVKFDLDNDAGEGIDSTGFYINGAYPTLPAVDLSASGIDLHGSDILHAHITYDGTTLTLTLIDTITSVSFTTSQAINIPAIVGGISAYAGFTGGTSPGEAATQTILNWTYVANSTPEAATPTFTPAAGKYVGAQSVAISDAVSGAAIYYTTNGAAPSKSSSLYAAPIAVSANQTLKAVAIVQNYANSAVASAAYVIAAPAPTYTPAAGKYTGAQSVSISDAVSGAAIYYTTDGTPPTKASTVYTGPIAVSANQTIKAIAIPPNSAASAIASAAYVIAAAVPTFAPAAGKYAGAQSVAISDAASGAVIYYTTDRTSPTKASTVYTGPIAVSASQMIKAIAIPPNSAASAIASAAYVISAAVPTFVPAAGKYAGAQSVAINDAVNGATIYYTTDGTAPTLQSTVYAGPIAVNATETLKAIAVANSHANSAVATAKYIIVE